MSDAPPDDDEALMRAYAAGDAAAFATLYDRHERPVHRFFLRQSVPTATADDLLQETWLAVIRSAARYEETARFTTWLYTIARSKLVDHWRATRTRAPWIDAANDASADASDDDGDPLDALAAPSSDEPEVRALSRERARAFADAVEALPGAQREAFLLHVDGELTLEDIAAVTSCPVETAKSRVRYAMQKLRAAQAAWLAR